jgi:hypothetical protein
MKMMNNKQLAGSRSAPQCNDRGMAANDAHKQSKSERKEERRRAARRRVLVARARRAAIVVGLLAIPALWAFERSGPQEIVEAEVTETRRWLHYTNATESHAHVAATLQIEGLSETTLERADGYVRGQRVPVWIRRGRLSGWPSFLDFAQAEELAPEPGQAGRAEAP